jgi:hypothetical protein
MIRTAFATGNDAGQRKANEWDRATGRIALARTAGRTL